ncbi:hypothetical protein RRG08_029625 [Elysia crispata]|uniref:Uncharacterized protein n=1 Tax=Elysia crispata TaxID=231223 RepID=A0AAE0XP75_9GAST|nr:hypothetical protein RRG08_029625 [Elysia crispata]
MELCSLVSSLTFSVELLLLMGLCLCRTNLANPTYNAEVPDTDIEEAPGESWSTPSVNILSVERSPAPGGSKFSVSFAKNADVNSADLFTRVYDEMQIPRTPDSLTEEAPGVWLAEIIVNRDAPRASAPWVYIGNNDDYMVGLKLANFESRSASQDTINTPVLNVRPALEAVYEPGQDAEVTVSSPFIQFSTVARPFYTYFTGVDLLTNQFHFDFENVDLFNKTEREPLQHRLEQTVTILTSEHPVSGLMEVTMHGHQTGGSLVAEILVSKYIKVRPSNQTSYLPPGFLAFVERFRSPSSRDGKERFSCRNINTCKPMCRAVGESLSDLLVFQVLPDGAMMYVPPLHPPTLRDTYRSIYWHINNEDGSLREGDFLEYMCVAFDPSNQNVVSKSLDVWIAPALSVSEVSSRSHYEVEKSWQIVTTRSTENGRPCVKSNEGE